MPRQPLVVRDARPDDAGDLIRLWNEAGHGNEQPGSLAEDAAAAIAHLNASSDERLLVGEAEGQLVAALHLRRAAISPIHTEQVVHTSFLLVLPEHRRHGHARALLDAAAVWAEEKDIHHVSAITSSNLRETNRFLARLGLGTIATVRLAPTAMLRKKLNPAASARGTRNIGQVLAARRTMRRHHEAAEADQPG